MLYLFDIDGTLVDTGGAGLAALKETTCEIFGDEGPPLDLAGSTDLGIISKIHTHFDVEPTRERFDTYIRIYLGKLNQNLASGAYPGRVIGGVSQLLAVLSSRPAATLGLLTGNAQGGAFSKMRHFGLDGHFSFGAYGCDHADRNRLGPIALERAARHTGRNFSPSETWIIGDTPKDISCAHAIGARCLAVATGYFSEEALATHGADRVVSSLDEAIDWI